MEEIIDSYNILINELNISLRGNIYIKDYCRSWIIFSHVSEGPLKSSRNVNVAKELARAGHGVFLLELLTKDEATIQENCYNIPLLSSRLLMATKWLMSSKFYFNGTPIAYFGASTGASASLVATTSFLSNNLIYAIVCWGGRPDLVDKKILSSLWIPTLLIAGAEDPEVTQLNKVASQLLLNCQMALVPRATHNFEEVGAMDEVARLAGVWFDNHIHPNANKSGQQQI